jgi:hypothetical protein
VLRFETTVTVDGITPEEIFDFLANPADRAYQQWWPGTHLQFHLLKRTAGHIGDVVYMDEYIGERRVRMKAVVVEAVRGRKLAWQLLKLVKLPARVSLELRDTEGGVEIVHTTQAGLTGPGRLLDPVIRLFFSSELATALDKHVKTEFPLLRERLPQIKMAQP